MARSPAAVNGRMPALPSRPFDPACVGAPGARDYSRHRSAAACIVPASEDAK